MDMKNRKELAPIVVFTYCRKKNTVETITSLLGNDEAAYTDLIVYSDAPKNDKAIDKVTETRNYLQSINGFKSIRIIEREQNFGLAKNIMTGVTDVVNEYGRAIILEDDMTVSKYFLRYMNDGLERYKDNPQVASIHGYIYPTEMNSNLPETFFIKGADCWGWATWKRAWDCFTPDARYLYNEIKKKNLIKEFEFDYSYGYYTMLKRQINGKANSWAVCWYASAFIKNMLTLYPNQPMVILNGLDGEGSTHGENENQQKYATVLRQQPIESFPTGDNVVENKMGRRCFKRFFLKDLTLHNKLAYFLRCFGIRP